KSGGKPPHSRTACHHEVFCTSHPCVLPTKEEKCDFRLRKQSRSLHSAEQLRQYQLETGEVLLPF
ncbi:MAG: hypothetical protein ACUVQR_11040, partial [Thermogutta sp.]